ncbi:MAG: NAD+ synthase [Alphaproteobacteria bacterium]
MTDMLSIALAQINTVMGDIAGNVARIRAARATAHEAGADLVVFPELTISGYPPEDLVLKPAFLDRSASAVSELAALSGAPGPAMLIGAPWRDDGKTYNAALLLDGGAIAAKRFKHELPNYGVFDEKRVFEPGPLPGPINFRGIRLGVMVCEDVWFPDVSECLQESGAEILIVINGSPFETDKADERLNLAVARINESGLPIVYVNQIGGQDELVFDGASFVLNADRRLAVQAPAWQEAVTLSQWRRDGAHWQCLAGAIARLPNGLEALYSAMTLGLRDYVRKNGFPGVAIGLSGGIDSAISAAVAVDALGPDKVWSVMMPSPYTSQESLEDAAATASLLGIRHDVVSIRPAMEAFSAMLAPIFDGRAPDTTEENVQARARGITLMAISNKFGHMVLSTGNKSEMSVGYATLYGDMCGGYSVLKDVYKMDVFRLSKWRNQQAPEGALGPRGRVMPERVIEKPPSAELKPNQKDEDSLPPYRVLDDILSCLVEHEMGIDEIMARGHDRATVARVWSMLDRAEYKRRQAPPGVKLTRRAFGRDRRYPITNRFTNNT